MKEFEGASKSHLIRRLPVIIRVDGRSFSRYTARMKTYDAAMHRCMKATAKALVEEISGATLAYTQSDEISILVTDWSKYETEPWFGYSLQKVVSSSASIATATFNEAKDKEIFGDPAFRGTELRSAFFDSRAFNLPMHEVHNYFVWRQKDAIRNSVNTHGRAILGPKAMHSLSCEKVRDRVREMGSPWENLYTWQQRGVCIQSNMEERGFSVNEEIPVFVGSDYVSKFLPPLFWKEERD